MKNNLIKIAFLLFFLCFVFMFMYLIVLVDTFGNFFIFVGLFVVGGLCALYLGRRIEGFHKKLVRLFRSLITGNYEIGLKNSRIFNDEIETMNKLIENFLQQLRLYDKLRIDRIALTARTMDLMYNTVGEGIVIVNIEKNIFKCNTAVQKFFNINQETFTFAAIKSCKENDDLMRLVKKAVETEKIPQEGKVLFQMPVQNAMRVVNVKIIPIKDKEEIVKSALIFVAEIKNSFTIERGSKSRE